ncbi:2-hydroxychromene-2-carboxylate isomerase [Haliangium ochraceum]|uniref:2-hydroxychromene-2-carboxylate isomerase n=1 Tax=Haliangium ochraceum (strain DSM 14365 / JCM 11303 / SMP-2) TaxID=502025 RepID=D0LXL2_HALO1|nr:2-hydroxychromene-2-carboxylate isomerase [Haliangium ochraceum]ACY17767.1 DSBA oxidoreductase [Haliangium ochraceum DSM 14365]
MTRSHWTVDFYFDFLSPYSYFAWVHARPRCTGYGVHLVPRPVMLPALLAASGHRAPVFIPNKRSNLLRDTLRYAGRHKLDFQLPQPHPFHPVTALRLALPEVSGEAQERVIDAIWHAGWVEGRDLGDREVLRQALERADTDADALLAATQRDEVKQALRAQTEAAIARGAFGVPTFCIGEELFFGNDRVDDLCEYLAGDDPLDRAKLAEWSSRPIAEIGAPKRS